MTQSNSRRRRPEVGAEVGDVVRNSKAEMMSLLPPFLKEFEMQHYKARDFLWTSVIATFS
jgi:hypothetical protein